MDVYQQITDRQSSFERFQFCVNTRLYTVLRNINLKLARNEDRQKPKTVSGLYTFYMIHVCSVRFVSVSGFKQPGSDTPGTEAMFQGEVSLPLTRRKLQQKHYYRK